MELELRLNSSVLCRSAEIYFPLYFFLFIQIGFVKVFDFRFLMDLHVLGCVKHDLTISRKCLSVCLCFCASVCLCVYDKNFVASVARELMNRIS